MLLCLFLCNFDIVICYDISSFIFLYIFMMMEINVNSIQDQTSKDFDMVHGEKKKKGSLLSRLFINCTRSRNQ